MSEAPKQKTLRLGVVQGGKIIEEKLVRKRETVTVGTSPKCTLVLAAAGVPKSFAMFEVKGGDYHLCFTADTQGRVSVGDQTAADLQSLKSQNLVRRAGDVFQLRLSEASRGRIQVGEVILLFQFVAPPPEPVKPQLPASVRGYWTRNIDWPYASTQIALLTCMAALAIWAQYVPLPSEEMSLEDIPDRFAKMLMPDREADLKAEDDKGAGKPEEDLKPKKDEKKVETQPTESDPGDESARAAAAARRRADMEKKVTGRGLLKLLGAKGPGGLGTSGAVADVFAEGSLGDGSGAFEGIDGGLDVATGAGQRGLRGPGGGDGDAVGIGDLGTKGVVGGAGEGGKGKTEARVVAKVTSASLQEFDSDSRSQEDIKQVMRRRLGGIKRCYETRLKRNPELSGKVVVRFVIHPGGKVLEAEVIENTTGDAELAACIASNIKAIRFPAAEGGDTSVVYPFILAPGG
jgi:hypothetical protein